MIWKKDRSRSINGPDTGPERILHDTSNLTIKPDQPAAGQKFLHNRGVYIRFHAITMSASTSTHTGRLELIPATLEILKSDRGDRAGLGRLLNAAIPTGWPPPLLEDAVIAEFIRIQEKTSDSAFCCWYWVLTGTGKNTRTLIGSGGTASLPGSPDTVLVGYTVLEEFQGRGYATEAVRHMIPVIFSRPGIRKILATTYPNLRPSIRVLEKNGFVPTGNSGSGSGMEEGTLAFILIKPDT